MKLFKSIYRYVASKVKGVTCKYSTIDEERLLCIQDMCWHGKFSKVYKCSDRNRGNRCTKYKRCWFKIILVFGSIMLITVSICIVTLAFIGEFL